MGGFDPKRPNGGNHFNHNFHDFSNFGRGGFDFMNAHDLFKEFSSKGFFDDDDDFFSSFGMSNKRKSNMTNGKRSNQGNGTRFKSMFTHGFDDDFDMFKGFGGGGFGTGGFGDDFGGGFGGGGFGGGGFGGGGVSKSVSTSTKYVNGRRMTVTKTKIQKPDGMIEDCLLYTSPSPRDS